MKTALITGITGQDGYFLSQLLLEKGYDVHGLVRRNSQATLGTLEKLPAEIRNKIHIHWGDVTDHGFVERLFQEVVFDEVYHLAAQSFVGLSFENPHSTYDINIGGTLNIINAVKEYRPTARLYFAATSELYGKVIATPQNEATPFHPRSPYGVSKLAGFWTVKNYREAYDLFLANGILFNHESEVRGKEFVTQKIIHRAVAIAQKKENCLHIGNLEAKRDWGYAKDYVYGMWLILQHDQPEDFVLAMGVNHSVREFIEKAFQRLGISITWEGSGIDEVGINTTTGDIIVRIDPKHFRPSEVDHLIGDSTKAKEKLGWAPTVELDELVDIMIEQALKNT